MSSSIKPDSLRRLPPEFHERIWGSTRLEPWFPNPVAKIGEVWFRRPDSAVLIKFIFTTASLSIQVHPNDSLAKQHGHSRGKTEMWHILRAEPEAKIALGFNQPVTRDQVRRAAADGSILDLLRWIPVKPGQTWFVPAGAVHAIGAGIALCEVQQNSDVTYRLYDYGRGRGLHLEESLQAADFSFRSAGPEPDWGVVVDCDYFQANRLDAPVDVAAHPAFLAIVLSGSGTLNTLPILPGEVFTMASETQLRFSGDAKLLTVLTRT